MTARTAAIEILIVRDSK